MSAEQLQPHASRERRSAAELLSTEELRTLGHLCLVAMRRDDLDTVAEQHTEMTGVANPNKHGKGLFVGEGDVPMSSDNVYRQVHREAIEDMAEAGVVRGLYTATNGERAQTESHATYWNDGADERKMSLGGRYVIEASKDAAEQGWVKASDVKGIYARDADGELHDITKL